jgi:hypothetical protein
MLCASTPAHQLSTSRDFAKFFRISLHRTSRFRPLQGWFTPLQRLAMLLQVISFFMIALSALITAPTNAIPDRDRPSHAIDYNRFSV